MQIKFQSYVQGKIAEKCIFNLSLGFFGINGPSLERVTLPEQKVLNMG